MSRPLARLTGIRRVPYPSEIGGESALTRGKLRRSGRGRRGRLAEPGALCHARALTIPRRTAKDGEGIAAGEEPERGPLRPGDVRYAERLSASRQPGESEVSRRPQ